MLEISKDARSDEILKLKDLWDDKVSNLDSQAENEGRGKLGAVHVSQLWVDASERSKLIFSTALTIGIVLTLAFVGMLLFTRSLVLSVFVVASTVEVVAGLLFFIIIVMGWEVGLVEVVATSMLTGRRS